MPTKTFLFSDIAGSTGLWEKHPEAMKAALADHDRLTADAIQEHGGRVFKHTGDGFAAVFDSARSALEAARETQIVLRDVPHPEVGPLRVRVGVHSGEAEERDGDYFGLCLARAARLMEAGHAGQILVSHATAQLMGDDGPDLVALGEHRLQDLSRVEPIYQLRYPDAPERFPPLNTVDGAPNNLPTLATSFVGRDQELTELAELVRGSRLVTVSGVGGAGKTRLALQVAADLAPDFSHGAWLVELAPITDPESIEGAMIEALGADQPSGVDAIDALIDHLRDRVALVVMDNCEHLIDEIAVLVDRLMTAAPGLKLIATSRELLGVPGEVSYRLRSMSLPEDGTHPSDLASSDAAQLFVERGAAANTNFRLTKDNASDVAEICRRLDGLPLAIELAAARLRTFSTEAIAAHLDQRFRLLTGGSRTALPRQQTLTATIEWSYRMLDEEEAELFRRLSVFQDGFTFDSVTAVCVGEAIEELDILELLPDLVDKSLVSVDDQEGVTRYHLLETLRQFARDRLDEQGQSALWRQRHAEYFAEMNDVLDIGSVFGPKGPELIQRSRRELGNMRQALDWALANDRIDLAIPALMAFRRVSLVVGGGWTEALGWSRRILEAVGEEVPDEQRADILYMRGSSLAIAGQLDEAIQLLTESVGIYRDLEQRGIDPDLTREFPMALNWISLAYLWKGEAGDRNEVYTRYQNELLEVARSRDDPFMVAMALGNLAHHRDPGGDPGEARRLFEEAEEASRQVGSEVRLAGLAYQRAGFEFHQGDLEEARDQAEESERVYTSLGHEESAEESRLFKLHCEIALGDVSKVEDYRRALVGQLHEENRESLIFHQTFLAFGAGVDAVLERYHRVAVAAGASEAIEQSGQSLRWDVVDYFEQLQRRARSVLGEDEYERLVAQGRGMTSAEITDFLLDL